MLFTRLRALPALLALALTLTVVAVDHAEARRGGSFGSRGTRTYAAPPVTSTAPREVAPVQRTMTPRPAQEQTGSTLGAQQTRRPGLLGGFGGSLLGGLVAGGLLGMLLGHGFGGGAGFLGMILQLGLLALGAMLLMRFLRGRRSQQPSYAGPAGGAYGYGRVPDVDVRGPAAGAHAGAAASAPRQGGSDEIGLGADDFDAFERLLAEIQDAYAREDFGALRSRTTPEVMGFFSEELAANATRGLRNDVSGTRLLQGDLAEAWRENGADYATVAMRWENVDVMRDRSTGRVVEGDPDRPTEATELWTFVRARPGEPWKLSAIQEA
ncbi:Tim44 domain-containing protein [Oharaeibacter diazotrophicus]|uniref:Putative lipid-binding transport protein (Tim44 family) n=1 Tax=Oharaeibacter diazotrophicus TaxID=1920512 RepID=A0A4R6RI90_9HYPH|nr:TIM44-like domain-containing protein [Oharaeibacter diazotrophicus]TDP86219.1 putative lipid-binding transport protein (Tim44 family) [Oharaeibacter diazotrophicus]BBE71839.1 Tim44-like domain protein [Pleomorphomonas sp. SM30]GLS78604.1 membrane protein [Oharaeibacter diazotrophicus]